ncbi:hypothetical protein GE061_001435 [Apolygus lucorum]|uniref:Peptidase S1 domain-containing protein n=1 Tax=Apolygus lucorum TaxID=248454 RepID=A0A6A4K1N6_APOLU|nr:hypothetical protein GE061_001435 [Apolygus lucorum]
MLQNGYSILLNVEKDDLRYQRNTMKILISSLLATLLVGSIESKPNGLRMLPQYHAFIDVDFPSGFRWSGRGALITRQHVLTTWQLPERLAYETPILINVKFFKNIGDGDVNKLVYQRYISPKTLWRYEGPRLINFFVITLPESVTETYKLDPICLPHPTSSYINKNVFIHGWHAKTTLVNVKAHIAKENRGFIETVSLYTIDKYYCGRKDGYYGDLVTAVDSEKKPVLVGLGTIEAHCELPNVHVSVRYMDESIKEAIRNSSASTELPCYASEETRSDQSGKTSTTEEPRIVSTQEPSGETTEKPSCETSVETAKGPPAIFVANITIINVHVHDREPSVDTTKGTFVETTKEPSVETTKEPSIETTKEPSVETTKEPSVETTKEPSVETTKEPKKEETWLGWFHNWVK